MSIKETVARLVHRGFSIDDAVETAQLIHGDAATSERRARVQSLQTNEPVLTGKYAPVFPVETASADEQPRKRRRRWSRVAYVLTASAAARAKRAGKLSAFMDGLSDDLTPSVADTLRALVKAGKPVTARELEKLAGQKPKTVGSSVWRLREAGIIESQSIK